MDYANDYLDLVHDALYARSMKYVGCFAFNKSSERVLEIGSPILSTLERVLSDEVMPDCPLDPKDQVQKYPGMGNLLVDYFRIARDGQMERAAEFLSSLRGPVLIEAIRAISIVWDHTIPGPFLPTIETAARTGSPEEREVASWSLDWHHNKVDDDPSIPMHEHVLSDENHLAEKPFPWRCPKCGQPTVNRVTLPYSCQRTQNGRAVTVELPNLAVPSCANCGEIVFDYAADEQIRAALRTQFGPV